MLPTFLKYKQILNILPDEVAKSKSPPKSWARCKHSCAKTNSDLAVANSASCFHLCSLWASIASLCASLRSPN